MVCRSRRHLTGLAPGRRRPKGSKLGKCKSSCHPELQILWSGLTCPCPKIQHVQSYIDHREIPESSMFTLRPVVSVRRALVLFLDTQISCTSHSYCGLFLVSCFELCDRRLYVRIIKSAKLSSDYPILETARCQNRLASGVPKQFCWSSKVSDV